MSFRTSLFVVVFAALFTIHAFAETVFMPRTPALSPDGNSIAFSFQGDIWTVSSSGGEAKRITVHPGYEFHPVWSPDGSRLLFASDRYGTFDVFVIPSGGGIPDRLTYAQPTDIPQAWSSDGKEVYFASRGQFDYPMDYQIYKVPVTGGTPFRVIDCFAEEFAPTSDGKFAVFAIGNNWFGRKGYRGTYQSDLYRWNQGGEPVPITTHAGYDSDPMVSPDGNTIYFRSDSTGTFNLWKMNRDGSGKTQLTNFKDDGIRNARIADAGNRIVMEADSSLYLFDVASAKQTRLEISVASDLLENPVQFRPFANNVDELSVTSDGSEYAMAIRGELALVNREVGGRATLPVPDPARDWQVSWKPGVSDSLVFTTDRWGKQQIAMVLSDSATRPLRKAKHPKLVRLTNDTSECHHAQWSPLGDRIAYIRNNGELRSMKPDGSADQLIFNGWNEEQYSWSPDSKWIAFTHEDYDYNSDIWVIPSDGSAPPVNISQHPDEDANPVWSQDGRMLAWSSRRHQNQFDVYFVYLQRLDDERSSDEWKEWEKTRDKRNGGDKGDTTKNGKDKEKDHRKKKIEIDTVKIDFTDIHRRIRRISDLPGDEFAVAIHPKGDKFYFTADV
ncbi:MAG: hypothetical protein OEM52_07380, partial [bacterium]|nr:hypothetical protein [bacterium]